MMTVKYECAAPLDVIVTEGAVATKMYIISKVRHPNTPIDTHTHTHTCIYSHTYTHTYTGARTHTHKHTNTKIYIHIHTRVYICIYANAHLRIHPNTHTHTHTYTHIYTHTYTHTQTLRVRSRSPKTDKSSKRSGKSTFNGNVIKILSILFIFNAKLSCCSRLTLLIHTGLVTTSVRLP
jgi:hypothetical protein